MKDEEYVSRGNEVQGNKARERSGIEGKGTTVIHVEVREVGGGKIL